METIDLIALWIGRVLGGLCIFAGTLFAVLCIIDKIVTKTMKFYRAYDCLLDFLWNRKEFKRWLKMSPEARRSPLNGEGEIQPPPKKK